MPNFTADNTAAVAVVGADLFNGETWARSPVNRVLTGIAYTGSAVIGDSEIEVFIDEVRVGDLVRIRPGESISVDGEVRVGSFFNSALLTPQIDRDIQPLEDLGIPAGAQLRAVVVDAAATSIVYTLAAIEDV